MNKLLWCFFFFYWIRIIDDRKYHAACVMEYFCDSKKQSTEEDSSVDPIYRGYKAVLDSKAIEETLVPHCHFLVKC